MKFRTKLTLSFALLIAALVGGLFSFVNIYANRFLKNQAISNFAAISEISEGSYFSFSEKIKTRTIDWGSDGTISTSMEAILALPEGDARASAVAKLNEYLTQEKILYDPSVSIIDIMDGNGIVIASTRANRLGVNEKEEEEEFGAHRFSEAVGASFGEAFVTNVVYEPDEGMEPMIHSVTRIFSNKKDERNNLLPLPAVMLLHFTNVAELGSALMGVFRQKEGGNSERALFAHYKTADIYLVNKDRLIVTPSRFISDAVLKLRIDTSPVKACFEEGRETFGEYQDYRGITVFGSSRCLAHDNVVLIAEVQADEIVAPLEQFYSTIAVISAFLGLFGAAAAFFLSRHLLRNLSLISVTAEEVMKGNTLVRAKIKKRDEIGNVALVFNHMLDAVEKTTHELNDAQTKLRSVNIDLEQRIQERTAELERLKTGLEQIVAKRTKEMEEKMEELEKFKKLTVGRELKMIELKKEIERLKA